MDKSHRGAILSSLKVSAAFGLTPFSNFCAQAVLALQSTYLCAQEAHNDLHYKNEVLGSTAAKGIGQKIDTAVPQTTDPVDPFRSFFDPCRAEVAPQNP